MTQQPINIGSVPPAGDGDIVRDAFNKVNRHFNELYSSIGAVQSKNCNNQ